MLVWVYTCQNATLLEIICHCSFVVARIVCVGGGGVASFLVFTMLFLVSFLD